MSSGTFLQQRLRVCSSLLRPLVLFGAATFAVGTPTHRLYAQSTGGDPLGNPSSPVNLSTADWETFNERPDGRDLDAPGVPNLTRSVFRGGFDWLLPVFGPGLVIFRAPSVAALDTVLVPGTTQTYRTRVPVALVIDAFEALQNGTSGSFKRVPASLDGGFQFASGTYTSQSARRKVAATIGAPRPAGQQQQHQ